MESLHFLSHFYSDLECKANQLEYQHRRRLSLKKYLK
jgi:hypothetical protein